jgi:hypothetical protein
MLFLLLCMKLLTDPVFHIFTHVCRSLAWWHGLSAARFHRELRFESRAPVCEDFVGAQSEQAKD